jgi:cell division protein FtsL
VKSKLLLVIIVIIVFLSLTQLAISHNLATAGEKVRQLELQAAQLEKENAAITAEINKIGSLARIAEEAQKLGLVKTTQVLHLTPEIPVALK